MGSWLTVMIIHDDGATGCKNLQGIQCANGRAFEANSALERVDQDRKKVQCNGDHKLKMKAAYLEEGDLEYKSIVLLEGG